MKTMSEQKATTLLATAAGLALALTGTACSGGEVGAEGPDAADAAPARLATAEFEVDGMTCGGCALATEMAVKKLEGVKSADAEYDEDADQGRCTVEYDPSAMDTDRIAAAIRDAGFEPRLRENGSG